MEKYKIVKINDFFTLAGLAKKAEKYINDLDKEGLYEVISVSFERSSALITLKRKEQQES